MRAVAQLVTILSLAFVVGCGTAARRPAAQQAPAASAVAAAPPARRPATPEELERYAEREQQSAGLEKFEGGRIDTGTIVIVLLLVIIIILLV
jgi:hypothetical protein